MENENTPTPEETTPAAGTDQNHELHQEVADFVVKNRVAIQNALANPAILAILAQYGYTAADLQQALLNLTDLEAANEEQRVEYGEQYQATTDLATKRAAFNTTYILHVELARIQFKNNEKGRTALALSGERARSYSGYLTQAAMFYNNGLKEADLKAGLALRGMPEAVLQAGQAAVTALLGKLGDQRTETGQAQQATKKRDAAYDTLADWMTDFTGTARLVLAQDDQLMEEMGLTDPS